MSSFLKGREKPNQLLRAVLADLQDKTALAGCKALGLVSKLLMAPLWGLIENNDIAISEMGDYMEEILFNLNVSCNNVSDFMKGEVVLSSKTEWSIKKDAVYWFLLQDNTDLDTDVELILKVVLSSIATLLQSHYSPLIGKTFDDFATTNKKCSETQQVCGASLCVC